MKISSRLSGQQLLRLGQTNAESRFGKGQIKHGSASMNRDEIDQLIKKAKATLPISLRQREIECAIAKWKREHPVEAGHYVTPARGEAR